MPSSPIPPQPHHLEAERIRLEIARRMTVAEKLAAIHSLQTTAIGLKTSMLRSEHPEYSEEEVQRHVRNWILRGTR